jgi:hypothetical protein
LLDAGGDPRLRYQAANRLGHIPYSRLQPELFKRTAAPLIPGLYEPLQPAHPKTISDLMTILQTTVSDPAERDLIKQGVTWQAQLPVAVKGVYSSHPHFDSNLALPPIRPEIPLYASPETIAVLKALGVIMPHVDRRFLSVRRPDENGKLTYVDRQVHEIKPQVEEHISGLGNLTLSATDHFLGSTAADITTDMGARLTFTSDLGAGAKTNEALEAILRAAPETAVLFLDVNNLADEGHPRTVDELESELLTTIRALKKQNLYVQIPRRDLGRLKLISEVAKHTGRKVVVPWQLAAFQQMVAESVPEVALNYNDIYLTPRSSASYQPKDYPARIRDLIFNSGLNVHTPWELAKLAGKAPIISIIEDESQFRHINPRQFLPKDKTKAQTLIYAGHQLPKSEQQLLARISSNAEMGFTNLETTMHLPPEILMDFLSQLMVGLLVPLHTIRPSAANEKIKQSGFKGTVLHNIVRGLPYGYNGKRLLK